MDSSKKENLSENLEDYLEAISSLSSKTGAARTSDIAQAMRVKKPSVTSALNALAQKGLVEYEKYKPVYLTKNGKHLAENIRNKHELLSDFFTSVLGVEPEEADTAACKMEHSLGDTMMSRLTKFISGLSFCSSCPAKNSGSCECSCEKSTTLDTLKVNESGMIIGLDKKLKNLGNYAGMGITIGAKAKILRFAPLGDPVVISVHGSELSLRKDELKLIRIRKLGK